MLNEADTRAKLIDPKLLNCGWTEDKIKRDVPITPGKIVDENGKRQKGKKPDYILYYNSSTPIAVVEAKDESKSALHGIGQAKNYAQMLGVFFAYSSNGHGIEEFSFIDNVQKTLDSFPTPEELYRRYIKFVFNEEIKTDPLNYPIYSIPGGKEPRYYQDFAGGAPSGVF